MPAKTAKPPKPAAKPAPEPPAVSPIPVGTQLLDLDSVPPAVIDLLEAREKPLHGVAETWAACRAEIDPGDRDLTPRLQLAAWLKRLGVKGRRDIDNAAEAIAAALPADAGKAGAA